MLKKLKAILNSYTDEELEKMDSPYHIEFRNVSFSYNKKINNINTLVSI